MTPADPIERVMEAETLVLWMRDAAAKGVTLEVKSTGRWDLKRCLVLRVMAVNGELAHITIDEFAKAKGQFLRERLPEAA